MKDQTYFVFDVESVGLHGEGFAVGFVVVNELGVEIQGATISCPAALAAGDEAGRKWVQENCPRGFSGILKLSPKQVRDSFWRQWLCWKERGAIMVADCAWPVEARFLGACVDDSPKTRAWEGPYPLHDLASFLVAAGQDPLQKFARLPEELPEHDPLNDARQSARILTQTLRNLREGKAL